MGAPYDHFSRRAFDDGVAQRTAAAIVIVAALAGLAAFRLAELDLALFAWSKTWASYDIRQYLGMSKRFLLQYGYGLGLLVVLVASKYLFTGDGVRAATRIIRPLARYTVAVFVIHLPTMMFAAALWRPTPANLGDDLLLVGGTLAFSLAFGVATFKYVKPWFDFALTRLADAGCAARVWLARRRGDTSASACGGGR